VVKGGGKFSEQQ